MTYQTPCIYSILLRMSDEVFYLLPLYNYHNIMNLEKALTEAPLKHPEVFTYLYTHGAIEPGPDFGSSPSTSLPVKYCSLISDNASK